MNEIALFVDFVLWAMLVGMVAYSVINLLNVHQAKRVAQSVKAAREKRNSEGLADLILIELLRRITALELIAANAAFVGLAGTVAHIIIALSKLGGVVDMAIISGPIADSLKATLIGLVCAIPASAVVHHCTRRAERIALMESQR